MHDIRAAQDPAKGGGYPDPDVTIIGAGAAGSMAAIVLARRGIE